MSKQGFLVAFYQITSYMFLASAPGDLTLLRSYFVGLALLLSVLLFHTLEGYRTWLDDTWQLVSSNDATMSPLNIVGIVFLMLGSALFTFHGWKNRRTDWYYPDGDTNKDAHCVKEM